MGSGTEWKDTLCVAASARAGRGSEAGSGKREPDEKLLTSWQISYKKNSCIWIALGNIMEVTVFGDLRLSLVHVGHLLSVWA